MTQLVLMSAEDVPNADVTRLVKAGRIPVVSIHWLYDSIVDYRVQPVEPYSLTTA